MAFAKLRPAEAKAVARHLKKVEEYLREIKNTLVNQGIKVKDFPKVKQTVQEPLDGSHKQPAEKKPAEQSAEQGGQDGQAPDSPDPNPNVQGDEASQGKAPKEGTPAPKEEDKKSLQDVFGEK